MIKYSTRLPPGKSVFLLDNGNVLKTSRFTMNRTFHFMDALLKHLIINPDHLVVPIINYTVIDNKTYSYEMERLGILDNKERYFINKLGGLVDLYGKDAWQIYIEELGSLHNALPKLGQFLKTVIEQDRYHDLHSGNVMRDTECNYRLVDIEGFLNTPLSLPDNNWITR